MLKILVTGASGFVGKLFLEYNKEIFDVTPISLQNNDWQTKDFSHIDAVVHLAGKAHEMEPIAEQIYFAVNYELTKAFFQKVVEDGVKHFIYISSTKVYGDGEYENLNEHSACNPTDAYGKSKWKAEQFLLQQHQAIVSIIRPPLIYGPGVKGNLQKLMELCNSNKWLPFAGIQNKRSMVFVDNLIELIVAILQQQKPGIFVAGDAAPVSTTELVSAIRKALNRKKNLFTVPVFLRSMIKKIKPALYIRLFGSFYVSNAETNQQLGFVPKHSTEKGITIMVQKFLTQQ